MSSSLSLFPRPRRKVLSYGAGLDSYVLLLLAIERGEHLDAVVFLDVTDPRGLAPGEWPGTYRHILEVVVPLCVRHGIQFEWIDTVRYPVRDASSLFAWLWARGQIPVAGNKRICTRVAKVERFEAWLVDAFPGCEVEVWIGFESGEEARANKDAHAGTGRPLPAGTVRVNRFPLMEVGFCRCRCEAYVRARGLAVPRKSACVYCPYGSRGDWKEFARTQPEHFAMAVELEARKAPTKKNRRKLSIMDYRTIYDPVAKRRGQRIVLRVHAPTLPEFIAKPYRRKKARCKVCGAAQRATKETGCDYLDEAA